MEKGEGDWGRRRGEGTGSEGWVAGSVRLVAAASRGVTCPALS